MSAKGWTTIDGKRRFEGRLMRAAKRREVRERQGGLAEQLYQDRFEDSVPAYRSAFYSMWDDSLWQNDYEVPE